MCRQFSSLLYGFVDDAFNANAVQDLNGTAIDRIGISIQRSSNVDSNDLLDCLSPDVPARTIAWLASDPEGGREAGRYFHDCAAIEPAPQALDMAAASRLWDESAAILTRLGF